jgi:hypothetical protein
MTGNGYNTRKSFASCSILGSLLQEKYVRWASDPANLVGRMKMMQLNEAEMISTRSRAGGSASKDRLRVSTAATGW